MVPVESDHTLCSFCSSYTLHTDLKREDKYLTIHIKILTQSKPSRSLFQTRMKGVGFFLPKQQKVPQFNSCLSEARQ